MRARTPFAPTADTPRLWRRRRPDRDELWTETVGALPPVYGERWEPVGARQFRSFEPARSKLSAAIVRGWEGPLPLPGERWLYLGAASGTTASHVADLVGPEGRVYAVERSPRPFARLLRFAERWPNVLPILGDARAPERYADRVPLVDGIYADIAQADQVPLVLSNAEIYLSDDAAALLLALKTSSMGRSSPAIAHLRSAEAALTARFDLGPSIRLDPFYRAHYLVGGRRERDGPLPAERRARAPVSSPRGPRPVRRRS